jgi:hypothetical protein
MGSGKRIKGNAVNRQDSGLLVLPGVHIQNSHMLVVTCGRDSEVSPAVIHLRASAPPVQWCHRR